ncbi:MAG TPA: DUF4202 domain-containing protein [Tepidisphaeraceae bacterium]|jgi:hypothetical protein
MPTTDPSSRFDAALRAIDQANAQDPHGKELLYAQRMSEWLARIEPNASEALRLATRAQHIRRWVIPRADYPMDRIGYLKWRTNLYKFHADQVSTILRDVGYDEPTIARVASLVRKERIKTDPDAQTLEDVICLVFLENYFAEFAASHDQEKVVGILRKTWRKMSERGRQTALTLKTPPQARQLIERALAEP